MSLHIHRTEGQDYYLHDGKGRVIGRVRTSFKSGREVVHELDLHPDIVAIRSELVSDQGREHFDRSIESWQRKTSPKAPQQ